LGQAALREAWLLDPISGRLDAFEPSIRAAVLAVSPDGARLAYLHQAPPSPPGQAGVGALRQMAGRLDEVWVATQDDRQPLRRVFQLPPPARGSGYGTPRPTSYARQAHSSAQIARPYRPPSYVDGQARCPATANLVYVLPLNGSDKRWCCGAPQSN
jgi:hypothetical protein